MSTIRERDAEIHSDEWGWVVGTAGQSGDRIAEDRRALLTLGDVLAELAVRITERPGLTDAGGDDWWKAHDDIAAAAFMWKAATG